MGKNRVKYGCSQCGYEAAKWLGRCPGCGAWNTMVEEVVRDPLKELAEKRVAVPLSSIADEEVARFSSGIGELDRVLGGGVVPGSLVLLGGDPGIGKSTLLLQAAAHLARQGQRILYLSGEESLKQVRMRSLRLGIESDSIFLLNEQDIDYIPEYIREINPLLVIIDSIQTVFTRRVSAIPGTVAQLKECTARIMEFAKQTDRAFFLVGHVTKEGALAGPKLLEHLVDTVIYFEGDSSHYRILRTVKNRFGSANEVGLLEMSARGILEVPNPSQMFLTGRDRHTSGSAVVASFEGTRTLLVEVQALVAPSGYGYPRRMVSGLDQNRLALIVAVLEKKCGLGLSAFDVYVKTGGGVFVRDPAVDLGVVAAIASSFREIPVRPDTIFVGEVGLSGEIRAVPLLEARLREAAKLGFSRAVIPVGNVKDLSKLLTMEMLEASTVEEALELIP